MKYQGSLFVLYAFFCDSVLNITGYVYAHLLFNGNFRRLVGKEDHLNKMKGRIPVISSVLVAVGVFSVYAYLFCIAFSLDVFGLFACTVEIKLRILKFIVSLWLFATSQFFSCLYYKNTVRDFNACTVRD